MASHDDSQWIFTLDHLCHTPCSWPLQKQLYDRARGVEFLFRLGSSLGLPNAALFTAATWFHRFYMRYPMEEFHRQDVAAASIFLATKTEECGRKLHDVALISHAKANGIEPKDIPTDSKEVEQVQTVILLTEEVLLEAICFDFTVESPHTYLVDLFDSHEASNRITQEYAWSLAHDSYRTPMCILFTPRVIAAACHILAEKLTEGPNSASLDARISSSAPTTSLPTPPSHKPASPDASRQTLQFYALNEDELRDLSAALGILLDFYSTQNTDGALPYIEFIKSVPPPVSSMNCPKIYSGLTSDVQSAIVDNQASVERRTPTSSHGGQTPITHAKEGEVAPVPEPTSVLP